MRKALYCLWKLEKVVLSGQDLNEMRAEPQAVQSRKLSAKSLDVSGKYIM